MASGWKHSASSEGGEHTGREGGRRRVCERRAGGIGWEMSVLLKYSPNRMYSLQHYKTILKFIW